MVRTGGVVAVGAISRFASLFDGLARGFLFDDDFVPIVQRDLAEGQHRNPASRPHGFTNAYFHHPDELRDEVEESGLEVVGLVGLEGLGGWLHQLAVHWEDPVGRERIMWAAEVIESEPSLLGLSGHLLLVAPAECIARTDRARTATETSHDGGARGTTKAMPIYKRPLDTRRERNTNPLQFAGELLPSFCCLSVVFLLSFCGKR